MKFYPKVDKPIIYLSGGHLAGTDEEEQRFMDRSGCKFRCFSFGYTCPGAFYYNKRLHRSLDNSLENKVGIMMDSGAFSFQQFVDTQSGVVSKKKKKRGAAEVERLKEETIELYVAYCKKEAKKWDFYFNFDYIRDPEICYRIQARLEKEGIRPMPVFHGYYDIGWFERYCKEGYKLIGISGIARRRMSWKETKNYVEQVHRIAEKYGVRLHGLAVTTLSLMFGFPWHSVDSATWAKVAGFGKIVYLDPRTHVLGQIHISEETSKHNPSYNNMPKALRKEIERGLEDYGFDFGELRTNLRERCAFNAMIFSKHLDEIKQSVADTVIQWDNLL